MASSSVPSLLRLDPARTARCCRAAARTQTKYRMYLALVGADVPAEQRLQVGHAVDAAGVALLADDQHGQDQRHRLRDDGEVHAADAALEHREADDEGQQRGHQRSPRAASSGRLLNGSQNSGSSVSWFQSMKSGMPGVDWILVLIRVASLELEEHRHAVAAEAEEHALAQAQHAAVAPQHHQADGDEGVGQVLADQVEAEDVERSAAAPPPAAAPAAARLASSVAVSQVR